MSTRCNIIVKDRYDEVVFYRHSDGYPEGALPLLEAFMEHVKAGRIRNNVNQASGWLVLLGAAEYQTVSPEWFHGLDDGLSGLPMPTALRGWQVGSIEPTTCIHGDIEHLYVVDLVAKEILVNPDYAGKFATTEAPGLLDAAKDVVSRWEGGDLAGAVRNLAKVISDAS